MIIPACDSGLDFEANEASENAMNRRSSVLIGCIVMVTSLCFLAICNVLLAIISVWTVAQLILDWSWLSELVRSGRV